MPKPDQSAQTIALFCRLHLNAKKDLPIRSSEMGLLIYLAKLSEPATPIQVAHFLKVSKPRITQALSRLEAEGYIQKCPSPTDGRSVNILPTEKAMALVAQTEMTYFQSMVSLEEKMGTKDFQTMIRLLDKANGILLEEAGHE